MRWWVAAAVALLVGLSAGVAGAQPAPPDPTATSTTDDLTDMVLDAIEQHAAAAPTPPPAPQN